MKPQPPKGWYRRGDKHPPHFDAGDVTQFVTFRLDDSLPQQTLNSWKMALEAGRMNEDTYHARIEAYLDAGHGECWLRDLRVAALVRNALLYFDDDRYDLYGWVVMPNHVHALLTPRESVGLRSLLHSWKSFTSKVANKILNRAGTFWQDDYFDRYVRDRQHFDRTLGYIADNPVVAGLCRTAEDWPWSHAGHGSATGSGGRASRTPHETGGTPVPQ